VERGRSLLERMSRAPFVDGTTVIVSSPSAAAMMQARGVQNGRGERPPAAVFEDRAVALVPIEDLVELRLALVREEIGTTRSVGCLTAGCACTSSSVSTRFRPRSAPAVADIAYAEHGRARNVGREEGSCSPIGGHEARRTPTRA